MRFRLSPSQQQKVVLCETKFHLVSWAHTDLSICSAGETGRKSWVCNFRATLCSDNKHVAVSLLYILLPSGYNQELLQSCAFSLFQSQMETSLPRVPDAGNQFLCVFPYLPKLQNRTPLWGPSPTVCFKLKTNRFPIQPLRFKFQWKCRGNQMWEYRRVMNISS